MKSTLIALSALALVAGCTTAEHDAAVGAGVGATIGAIATGKPGGALIGALAGGATGVLLGAATHKGECRYRNKKGHIYIAPCPAGYY
jgi:hypothetical protein